MNGLAIRPADQGLRFGEPAQQATDRLLNPMTFAAATNGAGLPDMTVSVRQVFGIDTNLEVPAYSRADEHVPDIDPDYQFNREVTHLNDLSTRRP